MRLGILTGGGDCPGFNAIIRAVVRKGMRVHDHSFVGFRDGWRGVLDDEARELEVGDVTGILHRGGTILGSSGVNPIRVAGGAATVRATFEARKARRPDRDRWRGHAGCGRGAGRARASP